MLGGAFLFADPNSEDVFCPEDFSSEHLAIARTAQEFWTRDVAPHLDEIQRKEPGVLLKVLRNAAALGLTGISIPELFGGMDLDLPGVMLVEECFAKDASFLVTYGGHTGIGALPLIHFGNHQQKARYLPKLARAEWIAAYALTEPQAGSDALNVRTHADLNADGTHYILTGQKMWITNGAIADLFTVFAKVNGEHFTAFLVERSWAGVSVGAEERKMGLHGSSTTAIFFDHVAVPVANVLGEIGRGHIVAFHALNIGRLKVGAYGTGASKEVLALCLRYAKERTAFGRAIAEFGAIQHKLAAMAMRIFAMESMYWRVVGLIGAGSLAALEEYAIECSIVKVYASEAVGFVVDEGVQIHGGYGYHQDYAVERAYRDARIFRIFEGTNEINRLLIGSRLRKGIEQGRIDPGAVRRSPELTELQAAGEDQETLMAIADRIIHRFACQSMELRARKMQSPGADQMREDSIAAHRAIAQRLLKAGRYVI